MTQTMIVVKYPRCVFRQHAIQYFKVILNKI